MVKTAMWSIASEENVLTMKTGQHGDLAANHAEVERDLMSVVVLMVYLEMLVVKGQHVKRVPATLTDVQHGLNGEPGLIVPSPAMEDSDLETDCVLEENLVTSVASDRHLNKSSAIFTDVHIIRNGHHTVHVTYHVVAV